MSKYKVSVIIPVYGVEKYIGKCLDSLVNQTLKDIEIIVVNDGTKDNSQKIIDKYAKKYKNIKALIKENGGQGSARNYGLELATGEYIGYVDGDDYVEYDMYEKLYNKAKENDLDVVICGNYNVSEDYKNKTTDLEFTKFDDNFINALLGKKAVWNKIYKRNIIGKTTFRSKVWYEDFDFSIKVLTNAKKIDYVNEPLYDYLIREGSTMNNSNVDRNLEILLAFDEIIKNKKYDKYREIIEFLAIDHIYISTIVRIINADVDKNKKKEVIDKLINYMNNNFPNFEKNKYINSLSKNRKIIYNLIKNKKYKTIKLIFKIKKG
mgnify:CR=1 FL=1